MPVVLVLLQTVDWKEQETSRASKVTTRDINPLGKQYTLALQAGETSSLCEAKEMRSRHGAYTFHAELQQGQFQYQMTLISALMLILAL